MTQWKDEFSQKWFEIICHYTCLWCPITFPHFSSKLSVLIRFYKIVHVLIINSFFYIQRSLSQKANFSSMSNITEKICTITTGNFVRLTKTRRWNKYFVHTNQGFTLGQRIKRSQSSSQRYERTRGALKCSITFFNKKKLQIYESTF